MNNCYLDAEAVITFFRMTGRKHIFITGSRGSGKSHLVNNMLKYMSDSFNLLQSHRTDTPQVVIKSNLVADNKEFVIGIPRTSGINPVSKGNNMTIIEDGFINCAIPAIDTHLDTTPERLFVIDELGYLESSCIPFQKAVEKLLDNSHVLAVIRKQSTEFLNRICNRKDVLVIDIDNTFETLSCIIMASGMSKRFGSNKLITDFNGRSLFENAVSISLLSIELSSKSFTFFISSSVSSQYVSNTSIPKFPQSEFERTSCWTYCNSLPKSSSISFLLFMRVISNLYLYN